MPKINFMHSLDINLEKFLAACSYSELMELDILLDRELRIRNQQDETQTNEIEIKELEA